MRNFVAADVRETNRREHMNAVDDPANLRFPINGFEDSTRGGGCRHIIGDALRFHLGPGEERDVTPDA